MAHFPKPFWRPKKSRWFVQLDGKHVNLGPHPETAPPPKKNDRGEWNVPVTIHNRYHDALMEKESGLSKAEREMIVVATSAANHCLYCVVAHGAIVRIRSKDAFLADQIAVDWRKSDLAPRQKAMLEFAVKLAMQPWAAGEADFEALRGHGFSDEDIWDIGAVTALFAMSNRMAHLTAMRPNDEFFLLGRVPSEGRR